MKRAYEQGWQARLDGVSELQNPYSKGAAERVEWDAGYRDCDDDHYLALKNTVARS